MNKPLDMQTLVGLKDPAAELARFVVSLKAEDIPSEVRARARHHLLDAAGIALASTKYDFAQRTFNAIAGLGGSGRVPVIGMPMSLAPRDAATVNGLLCHGLDFDDTHLGGIVHPTASALPVSLSAAIHTGASGRDLVTAAIIGIETSARIGAVAKGGFHQVGFHPTGLVGAFGCALAAGYLFGLSERELTHAQGIVLSFASGSLEFLEDGAWNKRIHPGWAAAAGITAAALAKQGFKGAGLPYFGRFGLFASHLGPLVEQCDFSLAAKDLGQSWEVLNTAIKPYPACHFTHACVDAAIQLREQGVQPDEIVEIEALVPAEVVKVVCEPEASKKKPANSYEAQFSIPYLVACGLALGKLTLTELEEPALTDPAILALAQKVRYSTDPASPFPRAYSGEVRATLKDGRTLTVREEINRGAPDRPLSDADILEKFRANAASSVNPAAAARIEAAVLGLDDCTDVEASARALAG
ncbi:2-methylcitrate dehydratase [Agaricicola taiwanensis]|uniref:2-methylcitrate dehydratase n=1 Tax=Agaricicola taiwanensis TaxID=591372 RepID=A0A8J2YH87_9RHOB|nr:MmgE/PrpD family protein [Agaricicola taiwanensis]GGE41810.1 2-methylcitrate dehydratase [Agaricicola taiwanensis]